MGWGELAAIFAQQRDEIREENERRPVACPNDGTPLEDVNGVLHCPMGDYTNPVSAEFGRGLG